MRKTIPVGMESEGFILVEDKKVESTEIIDFRVYLKGRKVVL